MELNKSIWTNIIFVVIAYFRLLDSYLTDMQKERQLWSFFGGDEENFHHI